ncbi:MAG: hypothetical protein L0H79_08255 [Intrasporangium sp.]|uniref:hypothetical protein n=1 Tax=Intrasporangium sp. TaxID=1925024 RepID=UPI00264862D1|nr:hypothetical protein [Intrasporangium sp.]MDN5795729.1 hypothetical protein [Intrasporangium sp.]
MSTSKMSTSNETAGPSGWAVPTSPSGWPVDGAPDRLVTGEVKGGRGPVLRTVVVGAAGEVVDDGLAPEHP